MGVFKLQLNMLNFKRKHILLAEDLYHTCGRFYLILNWNWTYAGPDQGTSSAWVATVS